MPKIVFLTTFDFFFSQKVLISEHYEQIRGKYHFSVIYPGLLYCSLTFNFLFAYFCYSFHKNSSVLSKNSDILEGFLTKKELEKDFSKPLSFS